MSDECADGHDYVWSGLVFFNPPMYHATCARCGESKRFKPSEAEQFRPKTTGLPGYQIKMMVEHLGAVREAIGRGFDAPAIVMPR